MKILRKNRGEGKTTELIKKASEERKYIICRDEKRARLIIKIADDLGLYIPFPVTIKELPLRSGFIESVLVDDIEDILEYITGKPIELATTSCEIMQINPVKKGKWLQHHESPLLLKCSACEEAFIMLLKYCPFCGADMREDEDENK